MNTIVLHAGMPKTGSTSIQQWLQGNAAELQERGLTVLSVGPPTDSESITFAPCEGRPVNCSWIAGRAGVRSAAKREAAAWKLVRALADAAAAHGDIVVSGETFAIGFSALHEPTLASLEWLAEDHQVQVAYYARPQHTCLEARWRQSGYRLKPDPSSFVEQTALRLAYASTRRGVNSAAPSIEFDLRPFRPDLLRDGDVVSDFAWQYCGVDDAKTTQWANRNLPLEVVNLLRHAPDGMFWEHSYGNERVGRIKQLLSDVTLPDDDRIALSRRVLHKFAFDRFGTENAELGWDDFVPRPDDAEEIPGIDALDSLWKPQASPAELALVFRALEVAIRA